MMFNDNSMKKFLELLDIQMDELMRNKVMGHCLKEFNDKVVELFDVDPKLAPMAFKEQLESVLTEDLVLEFDLEVSLQAELVGNYVQVTVRSKRGKIILNTEFPVIEWKLVRSNL